MKRTSSLTIGAIVIVGLYLVSNALIRGESQEHSYMPPQGLVPDERTAIRVAEAIWEPIYGISTLEKERPFKATLVKGQWEVRGTLPQGHVGGVALAVISQRDGRILRVSHGK